MTNRILSPKQWAIMDIILRGNPDGSWTDLDEIIDRVDYKPSKQSIQFSIRSLIQRGLIEKKPVETRRGQERRIIAPTTMAYEVCRR